MSYALRTLWHERQRYVPAVLAIGFSALLMATQCGLLVGMFAFASIPVDHACADVWAGSPGVTSVDLGRPMRETWIAALLVQPEVEQAEAYIQGFGYWLKPEGGTELCMVIGTRLEEGSLGCPPELTRELRARLTEPMTIVMDDSDLDRLGVHGVGDYAQVYIRRVRVVGLTHGLRGLAGAYLFCSLDTARSLLHIEPGQVTYVLGRCKQPADAAAVVARLRAATPLSAFTRAEFSRRSRLHWLIRTKAGLALGLAAALGLVVGAVVTTQTLAAATAASIRQYAVLWALGIPMWRMASAVLMQSFWVGALGILLALSAALLLAPAADELGVRVDLPAWLLGGTATITLLMALLSGLASLRALRRLEPVMLLR
ncbi:MAG TPA: FtsX-like permease family protein [Gemmataceae bacterium]|nr:FtsX-like permease family protein [Gemmataceae bacterium]